MKKKRYRYFLPPRKQGKTKINPIEKKKPCPINLWRILFEIKRQIQKELL